MQDDLEFSDLGRSPRFVSGWWVLPALAISMLTIMLVSWAASAQTPQVSPTPQVQALSQKLMQEINTSLQCTEQSVSLQQQLAAAHTEIAALKAKLEPPKPEVPKK